MTEHIIIPSGSSRLAHTKRGIPTVDELHARLTVVEMTQESDRERWDAVIRTVEGTAVATRENSEATRSLQSTVNEHIKTQEKSEQRTKERSSRVEALIAVLIFVIAAGEEIRSLFIKWIGAPEISGIPTTLVAAFALWWIVFKNSKGSSD